MNIHLYFLYFAIGIIPCILWLLLYLRQDVHPESNKNVIKIFLLGGLITVPVIIIEKCFSFFLPDQNILYENLLLLLFYYIIGIGLVEEFSKYFIVKTQVMRSSHFDEPIDAMLYLIIAGLGFAAIENILVIFNIENLLMSFNIAILGEALIISTLRLLTAIFLHTLSAAIVGYFLALSLSRKRKKRKLIVISGLLIAGTLHGLYDVSMVKLSDASQIFHFIIPIAIIFFMGILVYIFFLKVKKLPRGCKF